jgi:uncharacterized SAM-binding protein YcdF (DUF218 family)
MRLANLLNFAFSIGALLCLLIVFCVSIAIRPRSQIVRWMLALVVLGYTAISIYPVPRAVNGLWSRPFAPLAKADLPPGRVAIVVLGSGSYTAVDWNNHRTAVPDPIGLGRTLEAARVYSLSDADWVVSSGGPPEQDSNDYPAAEAMRDTLLRLGVPAARLVMKGESRDTHEEALTVARILPTLQVDRVVLVTSPLHMRRATATFRAAGVEVIPAPAREDITGRLSWRMKYLPSERGLYESALVAHELLGYVYYRLRGWR